MARRAEVNVRFHPGYPARVVTIAAPKMAAAADLIEHAQREAIPVSADGSYGHPPGHARERIQQWRGVDSAGPYIDIGSDATTPDGTSYPAILDAGARPHIIESHGDYPLRNRRTGQVFGRTVHHPGITATHWCRNSILAIAGRVL